MGFLNKLERKIGKYAIPNLAMYLVLGYAIGYVLGIINSEIIYWITLNPFEIMRGQVWRLFTWILVPPTGMTGSSGGGIFMLLLMCFFYYSIGTSLERTWGTFYFNVYIFGGIFFTILASFGLALYLYLSVANAGLSLSSYGVGGSGLTAILGYAYRNYFYVLFSTGYINLSMFLAFAVTYPNMQVLLMFIIPIKVKWLGILYVVMIVLEIIQGGWLFLYTIGASLLNFILFFLMTRKNKPHRSPKQVKRQMEYRRAAKPTAGVTRHKCAICGRTEQDDPTEEFRFCSKCEGNYEYCHYHLFTHEHVKRH